MKWVLIVSFINLPTATIEFRDFNSREACYRASLHFETLYAEEYPQIQKFLKAECIEDTKDKG